MSHKSKAICAVIGILAVLLLVPADAWAICIGLIVICWAGSYLDEASLVLVVVVAALLLAIGL